MTSGERRLAERLEQKLDDDYLLWYDVPVGPKQSHPDFVVMHPRRGVLILETKDWKLDIIQQATRQAWDIMVDGRIKVVMNPLAQARFCAIQVVNALERDAQLIRADGPHQGKLAFPWGHGVIFTRITRKQFDDAGLGEAIEPHYVICKDEMEESADAEKFQQRLWNMFPHSFGGVMSLPQLDRVRWIMFPQVRVQTQGALFDDSDAEAELPDIMRVMDIQQEQLARSLGDGHRVIHGVAGSGKTMILGYRAEYLAKIHMAASKPILILCYNEPLAVKLESVMQAKGLSDRVRARNFHKWCRQQLVAYGQNIPAYGPKMFDEMVDNVIRGVDCKQIPSGQYQAVLIDEGHDFTPEWVDLSGQAAAEHVPSRINGRLRSSACAANRRLMPLTPLLPSSAPNRGDTWTISKLPPPTQEAASVIPPESVPSITRSSLGSRKSRTVCALRSAITHRRPILCATAAVVPLPPNMSTTSSPALVAM
jgi:hypothetical protein